MIDSGSTFSYLVSAEFRVWVQAFHAALRDVELRWNRTFPAVKRPRVGAGREWNAVP